MIATHDWATDSCSHSVRASRVTPDYEPSKVCFMERSAVQIERLWSATGLSTTPPGLRLLQIGLMPKRMVVHCQLKSSIQRHVLYYVWESKLVDLIPLVADKTAVTLGLSHRR